jgi:hypothetical protein
MGSIKAVVFSTLYQFWWFVGVIALMGLVLYLLARTARRNYLQSVGPNFDTYFTGWIGTPVHEFGHWVFCLIFMHKVKEVHFFKPDPKSGTLGFVSHTYNKKSVYQRIGNFFIGIGPMLVGGGVLATLAYFMLPSRVSMVNLFQDFTESWPIEVSYGWKSGLSAIGDSFWVFVKLLLTKANLHSPLFWGFTYIALCISSHMMLSISDIKTALLGALMVLAVLLVANVTSELISAFAKDSFQFTISNRISLVGMHFGAVAIFLFTFSAALSFINMLVSLLVNNIGGLLKK